MNTVENQSIRSSVRRRRVLGSLSIVFLGIVVAGLLLLQRVPKVWRLPLGLVSLAAAFSTFLCVRSSRRTERIATSEHYRRLFRRVDFKEQCRAGKDIRCI